MTYYKSRLQPRVMMGGQGHISTTMTVYICIIPFKVSRLTGLLLLGIEFIPLLYSQKISPDMTDGFCVHPLQKKTAYITNDKMKIPIQQSIKLWQ